MFKTNFSYIRTNFFTLDRGYEGCQLNYTYEPGFSPQFIAYRAILYAHLDMLKNARGESRTSIAEMLALINVRNLHNIKSTPNYGLLWECLNWFIENGYFTVRNRGKPVRARSDFDQIKPHDLIICRINSEEFYLVVIPDDKDGFKVNEPFVMVSEPEFTQLTNNDQKGPMELFLAFLFAKKRIGWRSARYSVSERPICTIITGELLAEQMNCSTRTANRYLSVLTELDVLKRQPLRRTDMNKQPTYIYTINQPGWEEELKYGAIKISAERRTE